MASQTYQLAMRTDKAYNEVVTFLSDRNVSGWCVREVSGENEHWHWFIETEMKPATFRTALKRAVPELVGNGSYSVTLVADEDKYLKYMAKGNSEGEGAELMWRHGLKWTTEKIEQLHRDYWVANRLLKKRRAASVVDYVIDEAKRLAVQWDDRKALLTMYIKELVARNRSINTFAVKGAINLVQVKLCPNDQALDELVGSLL